LVVGGKGVLRDEPKPNSEGLPCKKAAEETGGEWNGRLGIPAELETRVYRRFWIVKLQEKGERNDLLDGRGRRKTRGSCVDRGRGGPLTSKD